MTAFCDIAAIPRGRYGAIVADPPWRFETRSPKGRGRSPDYRTVNGNAPRLGSPRHYDTLRMSEMMALPIGDLAAKDSVLFLWAIDCMLPAALDLGEAWGFTFKTVAFTWAKCRAKAEGWHIGLGYWTRGNPESCLLFTRGSPKRLSASVRQLIVAPRREHSRKPEEARERIEALVRGPYLELFAREPRAGWDAWGDQIGRFERRAA